MSVCIDVYMYVRSSITSILVLKSEAAAFQHRQASPPEAKLRATLLVYAYSHANSSSTATCSRYLVRSPRFA